MDRKKILIVDDNSVVLQALSSKLKVCGFEPLTAQDGPDAATVVRRERPDLILLDISFPRDIGNGIEWDGFRIMDWLRRMDEAKSTPIFIITAGDPEKYKERALKAGAAAFFHKPISSTELMAAIREALHEKSASIAA